MEKRFITQEMFDNHLEENRQSFIVINKRQDEAEHDRVAFHKEIMDKLTPLYDIFDFRTKLGKVATKWFINTTIVLGAVSAMGTAIYYLWVAFSYAVTHINK